MLVAVELTSVAADKRELRVRGGEVQDIRLEVRDGVGINLVAAVPVVWDPLVASRPGEAVSVVAGDGIEGFEDVLVQDTFGILGRVVGHEAVDEGEGSLGDGHAGDGTVVEVWVLCNGLGEALVAEGAEDIEVVVRGRGVLLHVVELARESMLSGKRVEAGGLTVLN